MLPGELQPCKKIPFPPGRSWGVVIISDCLFAAPSRAAWETGSHKSLSVKSLTEFSCHTCIQQGTPTLRAMVIEMVNSAWFLMGNDENPQSKENKVFMVKLEAVMGLPMWGWAAWFNSPTELRTVPRMGMAEDPAMTSHGHIQPGHGWEWRSGGAARWGMTARAKEIWGNGTGEAIPILLTQTQSLLCLCLLMNQRKLPPEPFAFQLLQLCFVSLRLKYSD